MSMHDWYWPAQALYCPVDGYPLGKWQGTDGPGLLFDWKEGEKHPIGQHIPEEDGTPRESWNEFTLPPKFMIYSYSCPKHHPVEAKGMTEDGVWRSTVVLNNRIWEEKQKDRQRVQRHLRRPSGQSHAADRSGENK